MTIYTEQVNDPGHQAINAITAISGVVELLAKNAVIKEATAGGIRTYLRWCATNGDKPGDCLPLARMVRDELDGLQAVARGDLLTLLNLARQQAERLIGLLSEGAKR